MQSASENGSSRLLEGVTEEAAGGSKNTRCVFDRCYIIIVFEHWLDNDYHAGAKNTNTSLRPPIQLEISHHPVYSRTNNHTVGWVG